MKTAKEMAIETMNIYRNWSYQGKCNTATAELFLEDTLTGLYETQLKADQSSIQWHVTVFRDLVRWDNTLSLEQSPPPGAKYGLIRNGHPLIDLKRMSVAEDVLAILSARYLLRCEQRGEQGREKDLSVTLPEVRAVARDITDIFQTDVEIWRRDDQDHTIWSRVETIKPDRSNDDVKHD
ncbi:MAG TPA: hypothetical protein VN794_18625 [Methylomirabilota bacterium]|nr:hypothetical protein [Methylomirabilota bacterium]